MIALVFISFINLCIAMWAKQKKGTNDFLMALAVSFWILGICIVKLLEQLIHSSL